MELKYDYSQLKIPQHIGIIMDGNGRWAKKQGKTRTFGHKKGANTLKEVTSMLDSIGVAEFTVYAFSTENWKRPKSEVDYLMGLLSDYLKESKKNAKKNDAVVRVIGDKSGLDPNIVRQIDELEETSKNNSGIKLNIALNYGGRDEIVRAVNKYFSDNKDSITEEKLSSYLDTKNSPDPELIIRSSGEQRISNFLLWQIAYSEFYFTQTLWPDFGEDDIFSALKFFSSKERRFGGIKWKKEYCQQ